MAAKKKSNAKPAAKKSAAKKSPAQKSPAKKSAGPAPGTRMKKAAGRTRGLGARLVAAGNALEKTADAVDAFADKVKSRVRARKAGKKK